LRVRIAEVKRTALKELGFNLDALFELGTNALFGLAIGAPAVVGGAVGVGDFLVRKDDTNSLIASFGNDRFAVDSVIDALADEGLLTVLAEPNLTALSGEHADFLAGGEFPIPVGQDDGVITIEFKRFGVFLSFMPVVLDNGRISLRVAPEVSELSNAGAITLNGFSIPALTTRKAVTTVELGSGESFAVAGLIQNSVTQSLQKFPGIGDVPVLGTLFRSDNFQRNESELVIIVTPYLVRPSAPHQLVDPTQGIEPPNDEDRYVYGRNYGELTGAASAPGIVPARRRDSGGTQTGFMLD
jgi:pilus assembly protein CpaC